MNIDAGQHCLSDFIEIRDGPSRSSPLLGRYCGNNSYIPSPVLSTSQHVIVILSSDGINKGTGFVASYSILPEDRSK
jgi:hypothetical protein